MGNLSINNLEKVLNSNFSEPSNFVDDYCFKNCYLEPVCNSCYGANLLINGVINKRDRSKCKLMQIRAVFTAALKAYKLMQEGEDNYEDKLTLKAIHKINELYNV